MARENCYDAVTLMDDEHDVTLLLKAWSDGEQAALDRLAPLETLESAGAGRASIEPVVEPRLRSIAGFVLIFRLIQWTLQSRSARR